MWRTILSVAITVAAQKPLDVAALALLPVSGAALGLAGAGIYFGSLHFWSPATAALATASFWAIASFQHLGNLKFEHVRVGMFIILAAAILKWQALSHVSGIGFTVACIAAQAAPRAGVVGMAWASRPVDSGPVLDLLRQLTTPAALAALLQGVIAAFLCGPRAGIVVVTGAYLIARAAQYGSYRLFGGINVDSLAATEQLLEIGVLALFTCNACRW
jgi:cobalamin synthase